MSLALLHEDYSGFFPFYIKTGVSVGDGTAYPVGMSLGKVLDLYWRTASFTLTGSASGQWKRYGFISVPGTITASGSIIGLPDHQPTLAMILVAEDAGISPPSSTPAMQQLVANQYISGGTQTDTSGTSASPPSDASPDGETGNSTFAIGFDLFYPSIRPDLASVVLKDGLYYPYFSASLSISPGVFASLHAVASTGNDPTTATSKLTGTLYGESFNLFFNGTVVGSSPPLPPDVITGMVNIALNLRTP